MSAALPLPEPFDLDSAIAELVAERLPDMRARDAFGEKLRRAVQSCRRFHQMARQFGYDEVLMRVAEEARKQVDVLFDSRPSQIAEQTMRSM